MLYNPNIPGHPYAADPAEAGGGNDPKDKGGPEKALDCVSTSSSSSSNSRSSSSSRSSSPRSSSSCSDRHPHRHGEKGDKTEVSQGLWASGGSLCHDHQHSVSSNDAVEVDGRYGKEQHVHQASSGMADGRESDGVSGVPVTNTSKAFARDGSYFFRHGTPEPNPSAAAVAAAYSDPTALTPPSSDSHPYNPTQQRQPPSTTAPQPLATPPRGRQHTPSPLPPRPRTSSTGTTTPHAAIAPLGGFQASPLKFVEIGGVGGSNHSGTAHPYQAGSSADTSGSAVFPQHQRQSSASSNHSVPGSGQSTPLAAPRPPRHPSEERAGMAAVWVDLPPSPVAPFVPTHLELQRRRTPRRGSAPPSPVASTLAASGHSANSSLSAPPAQPLAMVGRYSCPPPMPERVPLTSPTASVSSASPDSSPSSPPAARAREGDGSPDHKGTAAAAASSFPASPPPSSFSVGPSNPTQPQGTYTLSSGRVDAPPQPASPLTFLLPADASGKPSGDDGSGNNKEEEGGIPRAVPPHSSSTHTLDAAPHTRVALPPPASINHRSLFAKPQRSGGGVATPTDHPNNGPLRRSPLTANESGGSSSGGGAEGGACTSSPSSAVKVALPPPAVKPGLPLSYSGGNVASSAATSGTQQQCRTTVTVRTSPHANRHPLGYTQAQEVLHRNPDDTDDPTCVVVSPASPTPRVAAAGGGGHEAATLATEEDLVSSVSEGDDEVPGSGGGGADHDARTLDQLMDAVQRAKERAARRREA